MSAGEGEEVVKLRALRRYLQHARVSGALRVIFMRQVPTRLLAQRRLSAARCLRLGSVELTADAAVLELASARQAPGKAEALASEVPELEDLSDSQRMHQFSSGSGRQHSSSSRS